MTASEIKNSIIYLKAGYISDFVIDTLADYYQDSGVEIKNESPDLKKNLQDSIALSLAELEYH